MAEEQIRYDILINAKAAIQDLRTMSELAENNSERVTQFSAMLVKQSNAWSVPLKQLLNTYRQLNAEMAKTGQRAIFGNTGGQDIFKMSGEFLSAADAAGRFKTSAEGVVTSTKRVASASEEAEKKMNKWKHSIDVVRTALGTLVAVGVFQVLTFISTAFNDATKAARELEDSLFRLTNVEKILSQAGTEISMKGLQQGIKDIKALFPIFSQEDITQLVAQIAISTKELGLSEEQIIDLSKAIAILNIRSTEEETASQTAQKVISSLITDNAKGIAGLGLSFNENTMQIKGMELGIVTATHKLKDLTNEEKAQVKFAILLENTGGELDSVNDYLDTNTAKIKANKSAWHDLLTTIGQGINNIIPDMVPFLEELQNGLQQDKVGGLFSKGLQDLFQKSGRSAINLQDVGIKWKLFFRADLAEEEYKRVEEILSRLSPDEISKIFPSPSFIKDERLREIIQSLVPAVDTATDTTGDFQNGLDSIDTSKAEDELKDLLKALEEMQEKMAEKEADFQQDLVRFDADANLDRARMIEDYNLNVEQYLRQFALRRKELESKYRQKELEDERRFQEQMRQLRERFLYDLEDALRERDARQVLRLIDKYNMEKQALINENALKKKEDKQRQQDELDQLEAEKAERLRVMEEEFQLKQQRYNEDSALKRQRMEEDHAIEMQRLKEQLDEKLQLAAEKIAEEYGINEKGAQEIYNLLKKYYGTDGALAKLTAVGYSAMLGQASGFLSSLVSVIAQYQALMASATNLAPSTPVTVPINNPDLNQNPFPFNAGGYAKGGSFVATRPTTALFGEAGAELVTITPISQIGNMQGAGPTSFGSKSGSNSRIQVDVNLSPDLEARVVNKAMDGTAEVVSRINRSKS